MPPRTLLARSRFNIIPGVLAQTLSHSAKFQISETAPAVRLVRHRTDSCISGPTEIDEALNINIDDERYLEEGRLKAKRVRCLLKWWIGKPHFGFLARAGSIKQSAFLIRLNQAITTLLL